jgi:nucleoside-triphosphatase THEP1
MNLLITGPKGSGKSTLARAISKSYPGPFHGFRTSRGTSVCRIEDLASGKTGIIARGRSEAWTPEPEGFREVGIPSLTRALERPGLVLMDELGTFEDDAPEFQALVLRLLDSDRDVLAVTREIRTPFLTAVREHETVAGRIVDLGAENVNVASRRILKWLRTP